MGILSAYQGFMAQFALVKSGVAPSRGLLILIFCVLKLITTTNGILQKVVVSGEKDNTLQISFYRNLTALPVLLMLSRRWESDTPLLPERRHWLRIFIFSALAIAGQQTLLLYGLRLADSYILGVVLTNLNSVYSAIIGRAMGLEQLSLLKVGGIVLAVGGTVVMGITQWPWQASPAPPPPMPPLPPGASPAAAESHVAYGLGVIMLLLSPLVWAISLFIQKPLLAYYKAPVTFTFWSFAVGTVLNGVLAASLTARRGAQLWALGTVDIFFLVWGATFGSAVKYSLLSWLNWFMDATLLCVLDTLGHAAGVFIGAFVLQEPLYLRYLGAVGVFIGCLMVSVSSDWGEKYSVAAAAEQLHEAELDEAACEEGEEEWEAGGKGLPKGGSGDGLDAPLLLGHGDEAK